jgi:hypothetical protein
MMHRLEETCSEAGLRLLIDWTFSGSEILLGSLAHVKHVLGCVEMCRLVLGST